MMVEKGTRHRVVRLKVMLDDEYVTTFSGDGVIVASPTGSTGYSFSARGPIVSPSLRCLVVTPVAAHMVFDRAFVIGADERVTIEVIEVSGSSVRIGIAAPRSLPVYREEIWAAVKEENAASAASADAVPDTK